VIGSALHEFRERFAGTRRVGEVGAAIAIVLASLVFGVQFGRELNPLGRELKYLSYDIPFLFRPQADVSDAVIVYMDEDSYSKLNQTPGGAWHRGLHVQLLQRLKELGADAVVFDILFDKPWADEPTLKELDRQLDQLIRTHPELRLQRMAGDEVDRRFGEVAREPGKVVVGARVKLIKTGAGDVAAEPITAVEVIHTNTFSGITDLELQKGFFQGIRRHSEDARFTSMAQATAAAVKEKAAAIEGRKWINYYGPPGTITGLSYHQVFQPDGITPRQIAGKIVFIGMGRVVTPQGQSQDDYPTPYNLISENPQNTQGVEIQATACLNYLHGDALIELARWWQAVLFVVCGGLFGLLFALVRPWIAVVIAIFAFVGVAVAGVQTVWQTHVWFSWAIVALVQIPAALAWALLINTRQIYREKVALERKLATVTSAPPTTASAPAPASVGSDETIVVGSPDARLPYGSGWLAQPGDVIADHHLVRCVGEGAYGQVWLARNVIGTYAAIKLVYRSKFKDEVPFEREFQGLKRFMPISRGHPGLVQILHVGKTAQYFYYVMEAGDDETTQQIIHPETYTPRNLSGDLQKRASLPATECLTLAIDLSAALEYLHQRQLIHRDIKPSNIIFVNGQPKIADIGLVTAIATTRTDATYIGTPGYIPPEGPGTAAADVYSLGKVIYEASMGRHVSQCPALPTSLIERSDYKGLLELNEIVAKAAAENVQFRYQSAAALHRDLVELQTRLVKVVKSL
jgi:CHASE2 domain-containing sensor protein